MKNRSGYLKDTGKGYKAFIPSNLQDIEKNIAIKDLYQDIDRATTAIGELRALANLLPNPDLLLSNYAIKEALLSSEIEGTQSTLSEIFENEETDELNVTKGIREVRNYMKALNWAIQEITSPKGLPLSLRLLQECHNLLMTDVRGGQQEKTPGYFRTSQNWIGGSSPQNAIYVPPTIEEMDDLLGEMEKYIYDGNLPELVKIALLHYQFETIHPFLDGNGRIGRLLITLYLIDKKILKNPTLYISLFLKKRKGDYYDFLTDVRTRDSYENWIKFFLQGVVETSSQIMKMTKNIQSLQASDGDKLKTKNEIKLLDLLFQDPVVRIKTVEKKLGVSNQTANNLIKKFVEKNILKPLGHRKRYTRYAYYEYIKTMQDET